MERTFETMSTRHRWISLIVAVPGVVVCFLALFGFVRKIVTNGLGWHVGLSASEHYLEVGNAYSTGFATGFFLCFFLVLLALVLGAYLGQRRRPRLVQDDRPIRPPFFLRRRQPDR